MVEGSATGKAGNGLTFMSRLIAALMQLVKWIGVVSEPMGGTVSLLDTGANAGGVRWMALRLNAVFGVLLPGILLWRGFCEIEIKKPCRGLQPSAGQR